MSFEDRCKKLLDTALRPHVFGDDYKIEYLPKSGGTFFIRGIFDEPWAEGDMNAMTIVSHTSPILGVSRSELSPVTAVIGDKLRRRGQAYIVTDVQTDGQDGLLLLLNRVKP